MKQVGIDGVWKVLQHERDLAWPGVYLPASEPEAHFKLQEWYLAKHFKKFSLLKVYSFCLKTTFKK